MKDALPKVSQSCRLLTKSQIDRAGRVIYVYSEKVKKTKNNQHDVPYGKEIFREFNAQPRGKKKKLFSTVLPNNKGTCAVLALVDMQASAFDLLVWARTVIRQVLSGGQGNLSANIIGEGGVEEQRVVEALYAALLAGQCMMPHYKSTLSSQDKITSLAFYGLTKKLDLRREQAIAQGNNRARQLTATPANFLTPSLYKKQIKALADQYSWSMRFYGIKALQRKKAGAFLAVCQGSVEKDAGIVHLSYRPAKLRKSPKKIALVGKGICFDTGGTNLKTAHHMVDMHEDMEGSAVALGTLMTLTQMDYPYAVDCWLALAQNHIGPEAYKQSDVVTALNGTTIEIMHTDAEGRMVLADTLSLASQQKPDLIMDYATLTGSCVHALGTTYTGAFTNHDTWLPDIIGAGQHSGERVWPFPMDKDFDEALESQVADIKQCTLTGEADHILAARFLQRFVGNCPWIHLDLSAGKNKGGLAHIPTDITGFGVRFTLDLLLDKKILTH